MGMMKMFEEGKDLTFIEQQAVLYFKLHFKITDMMEDLKVFVGREYALDIEHVEHYSIYNFVVKLYSKLIKLNIIKLSYEEFILELFKYERSIDYIGMIKKLRALIQNAATQGTIGEPDFSLLPKKEEFSDDRKNYDNYVVRCRAANAVYIDFDSWKELQN